MDSCSTSNLFAFNCAINTSESNTFLEQPNVTTFTLFFFNVFVFILIVFMNYALNSVGLLSFKAFQVK